MRIIAGSRRGLRLQAPRDRRIRPTADFAREALFDILGHGEPPLEGARVLAQLRASRGGRLNDPEFGSRMRGSGAFAELIAKRMRLARRRCGIDDGHLRLRTDLFRRPSADARQMALL